MAARAISSATVSFGLVSIPVKLFSCSDTSGSLSLNWVHEKCGARVKQKYWCPTDEELVSADEMVKGYEFTKGQYVLFSKEELEELTPKSTQTIEITEFVRADQVDPVYFDKAYYLGPATGGERPYALLAEAMKETGRSALARYTARGKMYLVLLRPFENGVILQQLRYSSELRSFDEVDIGQPDIKDQERALARQLVEQIASDEFQPDVYRDDVRLRMKAMIEQKVEGKEVTMAPAEEPRAQIIDLMEALKASLGDPATQEPAAKTTRKGPATSKARKKTASARTKKTTRKVARS